MAVVIQDETIKAILVTESEDDEAFLKRAKQVAKDVVKNQTLEVDTVSGATYSSKGILAAIEEALKEAERITEEKKNPTPTPTETPISNRDTCSDSNGSTKANGDADTNPDGNTGAEDLSGWRIYSHCRLRAG
ncbi:MAG: FMN-binding protein [Blautia sp.]